MHMVLRCPETSLNLWYRCRELVALRATRFMLTAIPLSAVSLTQPPLCVYTASFGVAAHTTRFPTARAGLKPVP